MSIWNDIINFFNPSYSSEKIPEVWTKQTGAYRNIYEYNCGKIIKFLSCSYVFPNNVCPECGERNSYSAIVARYAWEAGIKRSRMAWVNNHFDGFDWELEYYRNTRNCIIEKRKPS